MKQVTRNRIDRDRKRNRRRAAPKDVLAITIRPIQAIDTSYVSIPWSFHTLQRAPRSRCFVVINQRIPKHFDRHRSIQSIPASPHRTCGCPTSHCRRITISFRRARVMHRDIRSSRVGQETNLAPFVAADHRQQHDFLSPALESVDRIDFQIADVQTSA